LSALVVQWERRVLWHKFDKTQLGLEFAVGPGASDALAGVGGGLNSLICRMILTRIGSSILNILYFPAAVWEHCQVESEKGGT
jgi:hypothetical protein